SAQMATASKPEKVYSCPEGASFTTLAIVAEESQAEVDEVVDHYLVGSVYLACNNGSYPTPTRKNEHCITVTGGDWFVSGLFEERVEETVGGTIVLGGGSFTDGKGTRVAYGGTTLPLTFNAQGILDLTTLTVVTTAADTEDPSDGVISLREAISYADARWGETGNVITFSNKIDWTNKENTISLNLALTISKTLTIDAGNQGVVLQGAITGSPQSIPIMQIVNNDKSIDVTLAGLTFRDGLNPRGGAIYNNENLTVDHCVFTGNKAISGAAIYHAVLEDTTAALTVTNSLFTNNTAMAQGGAVYCVTGKNAVGYATITNSTFTENQAGAAGAIYAVSSTNSTMDILIVNSTLVNNEAVSSGGAILMEGANTTITCVDSTLAMNPVGDDDLEGGSAVYATGGTFNAVNSILVGAGDSCQSEIYILDASANVNLYYCVYGEVLGPGMFNAVNSIEGVTFASTFVEKPQTILVTSQVVLSGDEDNVSFSDNAVSPPREESLAKLNPDGTLTIRLDSAAALMGTLAGKITNIVPNATLGDIYYVQDEQWWRVGDEVSTCDFDWTDTEYYGLSNGMGVQTTVYTSAQNRDGAGNAVSRVLTKDFFNIGAYAFDLEARSVVVTTAEDNINPFDGLISLREAVLYAGTADLGNVITFSNAVDWTDEANSITLSSDYGSLVIDKTITIDAGTLDVTINGNAVGSIFVVGENIGTIADPVKLLGLILTGGTGTNSAYDELAGGAVYNAGSLLISDCVATDNTAARGGGLYNIGYLTVKDTTFDANESGKSGGAIHNSGVMFVDNSDFTGNTSGDNGAGITNFGVNALPQFLTESGYSSVFAQIDKSTFSENEAQYGAAVNNMGTYGNLSVIINQSTFRGNTATCSGGAIALFAKGFSVDVHVYSS
ncbi:MAG: hypothetical protein PHQ75_07295, partial [Thermoguttaceae bacterium]|nr:hypothetical protein [Thermoguttaceae bacterium]